MKRVSIQDAVNNVKSSLQTSLAVAGRRQLIIRSIPYAITFYLGDKLHWLFRYCIGRDLIARVVILISNWQMAFDPV